MKFQFHSDSWQQQQLKSFRQALPSPVGVHVWRESDTCRLTLSSRKFYGFVGPALIVIREERVYVQTLPIQ
jgi:hypothetical protein